MQEKKTANSKLHWNKINFFFEPMVFIEKIMSFTFQIGFNSITN